MADIADQADDLIEDRKSDGIAEVRKQLAPESHPDFDGQNCLDCGDPIPAARLGLGKIRCVECQGRAERVAKRGVA